MSSLVWQAEAFYVQHMSNMITQFNVTFVHHFTFSDLFCNYVHAENQNIHMCTFEYTNNQPLLNTFCTQKIHICSNFPIQQ